jgi:hypothetical protein
MARFTFWGLFFASIGLYASPVRVVKLGNNGKAIVEFENEIRLQNGDKINLRAQDEEMDDFTEEVRITFIKIKGRRAVVKFPSDRSIRIGEVFDYERKRPNSKKSKKKQREDDFDDDDADESDETDARKRPVQVGFEFGFAYMKDQGGIEAGDDDYNSSYTWKNYLLGLNLRYDLEKMPIGFQSGLLYSSRNYSYKLSTDIVEVKTDWNLKSFEIPAFAYYKFKFGGNMAFLPGAGFNLKYGFGDIAQTTKTTTTATSETVNQDLSYDQAKIARLAYELLLSLAMDFELKNNMTAFGAMRIHYGLNDRNTNTVTGEKVKKDLALNFTAGMLF